MRQVFNYLHPPNVDKWQLDPPTSMWFNSSSPGQNVHHFADDILKCIFMNEKSYILIRIWLDFVPKGPIVINPALV